MPYNVLMKKLKISGKQTICNWKNYIRNIYLEYLNIVCSKICGINIVVQINESHVCKRKYHKGRVLVNQRFRLSVELIKMVKYFK